MLALLAEYNFREINIIAAGKAIHFRITKRGKLFRDEILNQVQNDGGAARRLRAEILNQVQNDGAKTLRNDGGAAEHSDIGAAEHICDAYGGLSHDRQKSYILSEGMPILPFVDLGVFDKNYRIIKSKYDKFRQINRFIEIIADEFDGVNLGGSRDGYIKIMDFGCGKSYLTFFIYYYFTQVRNTNVRIIGYDIKKKVVARCNEIAEKYGYESLKFVEGDVSAIASAFGAQPDSETPPDMLITLHACDTATDQALYYAIKNRVKYIFSVPCCQHELNAQVKGDGGLSLLFSHGLYKERFAAFICSPKRRSAS